LSSPATLLLALAPAPPLLLLLAPAACPSKPAAVSHMHTARSSPALMSRPFSTWLQLRP